MLDQIEAFIQDARRLNQMINELLEVDRTASQMDHLPSQESNT